MEKAYLESKWHIYGLRHVDETEYRYVGYTTVGLYQRLRKHKIDSNHRDFHVQRWIRSIGLENLHIESLEECPKDNLEYLCEAEKYWICLIKSFGHDLTNKNEGGHGGNSGRRHTEETKRKLGLASIGNKHSLGHKQTEEHKAKALQNRRKFKHTEETKNKMREISMSRDNTKTILAVKMYNHTRWHTNRDMFNSTCIYCIQPNTDKI